MTGAIPPELAQISNFNQIDLSFNNLTGCIPQELTALCDVGIWINDNPCLSHNGDFVSFCAGDPCVLPDEPACSACDDGLQNGGETGIDCGGSCEPCLDCNVLISDDFETGFGNWVDGGNDCVRSTNGNRSASGISSIRLRDDSNTSVMTSGPYDLSSINQVEVAFSFLTIGFEVNEDFWLQISEDGSNYTTVQAWSRTIDFQNNERHNPMVTLTGPFSSTNYFRFRADGSDNSDLVFIDDVIISSCSIDECRDGILNGNETDID